MACNESEPAEEPVEAEVEAEAEAEAEAAPQEPESAADEAEPAADRWPNEACARAIVVAYRGAMAADEDVTRTEEEARARAEGIRTRVTEGGEEFADVARADSDASSSGPRGGLLGTYAREDFPEIHAPIRDAVFDLEVGETSEVLTAPYGFVVARRCPVEKVNSRHILVRYAGARSAPDDVTRSREEARALAEAILEEVGADGADFAAIARERSEDASAERGGALGMVGRGLLAPAYEETVWELDEQAISAVVESEFGFHIIQRLPDDAS